MTLLEGFVQGLVFTVAGFYRKIMAPWVISPRTALFLPLHDYIQIYEFLFDSLIESVWFFVVVKLS